jgi:pantoate--beta-alanine ligase
MSYLFLDCTIFFPPGFATEIVPLGPIAERLEGEIQPGVFRSVATSMTKLFQLIRPDKVFLGQKKAQQVALIRKLVSDLNIDLTIHVLPIVRTSDGVAVRNHINLLSYAESQVVAVINRALLAGKSMIENGEHNTLAVKQEVVNLITTETLLKLDYVTICDPNTFEEMNENLGADLPDLLLAVSVSVGSIRLVDNVLYDHRGFWLT